MTVHQRVRRRPGRERLLAAMGRVLYRGGVLSTSVEDLLREAGVARGTLYKNFKTRDDLLDAYLRGRHDSTLQALTGIAESEGSLAEKLDAIFNYLLTLANEEAFRGCAFVVAAAELPDENRPPRRWARLHKETVRNLFEDVFRASSAPDPRDLAEQLSILYDGALVSAFLRPESNAVSIARDMAKQLVRAHGD